MNSDPESSPVGKFTSGSIPRQRPWSGGPNATVKLKSLQKTCRNSSPSRKKQKQTDRKWQEQMAKTEAIVRSSNPQWSRQEQISMWLMRNGLDQCKRVFVFDSSDMHIYRALMSRGWVQNATSQETANRILRRSDHEKYGSSVMWDLKWSANDSEADYRALGSGCFFNHFRNNRCITTKAGLNRSLRRLCMDGTLLSVFSRIVLPSLL